MPNKKYYQKYKAYYKRFNKKSTDFVMGLKIGRGCYYCGYNKCPEALCFHHIGNDKTLEIAKMANRQMKPELILEEIKKCILVCSNCHAEIHAKEGWLHNKIEPQEKDIGPLFSKDIGK